MPTARIKKKGSTKNLRGTHSSTFAEDLKVEEKVIEDKQGVLFEA